LYNAKLLSGSPDDLRGRTGKFDSVATDIYTFCLHFGNGLHVRRWVCAFFLLADVVVSNIAPLSSHLDCRCSISTRPARWLWGSSTHEVGRRGGTTTIVVVATPLRGGGRGGEAVGGGYDEEIVVVVGS
jgi:hypothetical protein